MHSKNKRVHQITLKRRIGLEDWSLTSSKTETAILWLDQQKRREICKFFRICMMKGWDLSSLTKWIILGSAFTKESNLKSWTTVISQERCFLNSAKPTLRQSIRGLYLASNQLGHICAKMNASEQCKTQYWTMKRNLRSRFFLIPRALNAKTITYWSYPTRN